MIPRTPGTPEAMDTPERRLKVRRHEPPGRPSTSGQADFLASSSTTVPRRDLGPERGPRGP
jgi:hypothetical protein